MSVYELGNVLPGTQRQIKQSSTLIYQGEVPRSGYYIKEGIVKAYTLQSTGEERIIAFFGPEDMFPMSWIFKKTPTSIFYYETITNCKIISITRDDITDIVMKNTQVKNDLLHKLINNQTSYLMRILALEQSRASDKILLTLYYLIFVFGKTKDNVYYFIDIKLTHAIISSLVGLTRETTATEINKLKKKKVLSYTKKIYTIDKKMLEKTIGEDSYSCLI